MGNTGVFLETNMKWNETRGQQNKLFFQWCNGGWTTQLENYTRLSQKATWLSYWLLETVMMSEVGIHFYDSVLPIHVLAMELCNFYIKPPFFILPVTAQTVKINIIWTQSPLSDEQRAGLGASSSLACGLLNDFGYITSPLMPQFPHLSNNSRSPDEALEISM